MPKRLLVLSQKNSSLPVMSLAEVKKAAWPATGPPEAVTKPEPPTAVHAPPLYTKS